MIRARNDLTDAKMNNSMLDGAQAVRWKDEESLDMNSPVICAPSSQAVHSFEEYVAGLHSETWGVIHALRLRKTAKEAALPDANNPKDLHQKLKTQFESMTQICDFLSTTLNNVKYSGITKEIKRLVLMAVDNFEQAIIFTQYYIDTGLNDVHILHRLQLFVNLIKILLTNIIVLFEYKDEYAYEPVQMEGIQRPIGAYQNPHQRQIISIPNPQSGPYFPPLNYQLKPHVSPQGFQPRPHVSPQGFQPRPHVSPQGFQSRPHVKLENYSTSAFVNVAQKAKPKEFITPQNSEQSIFMNDSNMSEINRPLKNFDGSSDDPQITFDSGKSPTIVVDNNLSYSSLSSEHEDDKLALKSYHLLQSPAPLSPAPSQITMPSDSTSQQNTVAAAKCSAKALLGPPKLTPIVRCSSVPPAESHRRLDSPKRCGSSSSAEFLNSSSSESGRGLSPILKSVSCDTSVTDSLPLIIDSRSPNSLIGRPKQTSLRSDSSDTDTMPHEINVNSEISDKDTLPLVIDSISHAINPLCSPEMDYVVRGRTSTLLSSDSSDKDSSRLIIDSCSSPDGELIEKDSQHDVEDKVPVIKKACLVEKPNQNTMEGENELLPDVCAFSIEKPAPPIDKDAVPAMKPSFKVVPREPKAKKPKTKVML